MIRKIFLYFIYFICIANTINAQSFDAYVTKIYAAEGLITQNKFQDAILVYEDAFAHWKKPFAIDYYNAMLCANYSKDYEKTQVFAMQLVSLGCELSFFGQSNKFALFRQSKAYFDFVKKYPLLRTAFVKHCNWKLRSKIEELNERDQYWRNQDPLYTTLKDSTFNEDDRIMKEILPMIKKNFPNEYEIGIFVMQDTLLSPKNALEITLLHNYSCFKKYKTKRSFDITKELSNGVNKGQIHPEIFAYLNDRSGSYQKPYGFAKQGIINLINTKMYFVNYGSNQMNIEAQRKKMNLCTIKEDEDKALYQFLEYKHYDFILFKYSGALSKLGSTPEEIIKKFFIPLSK